MTARSTLSNNRHSKTRPDHPTGFSLVELVMVLMVLVALAAMVVPLLDGFEVNGKPPERIATEATMNVLRDAIMGTESQPGAWSDLGMRPETFPRDLNLLRADFATVQAAFPSIKEFDPVTKIGWRGPYVAPGADLLDGWGNPIQIHIGADSNGAITDAELRTARLVSPGEDLNDSGDDVVLFLRTADPRQ